MPDRSAAGGMLRVHGLDLSYFTGKLEAYLRAKGLPYELVEMDTRDFKRCAQITGVAQMPQLEFPDGRWLTDSTAIIEHFERASPQPAIYPQDPALCFIAHLLEDFGDEWLWRPAMWYRWAHDVDARLASERLARGMMRDVPLPLSLRRWLMRFRQRHLFLGGDGITPSTAPVIATIYLDVLAAMQTALATRPFVMGQRPTQADIGLFGSMFRHFAIDPTPARIMRAQAPAVMEWVARLWNLQPGSFEREPQVSELADDLLPLLAMVSADYLPYLDCNEKAYEAGQRKVSWPCRSVEFNTAVSPYRVWTLQQLRKHYQALTDRQRAQVKTWLTAANAASVASSLALLARLAGPQACAMQAPTNHGGSQIASRVKPLSSQWHS